MEVRILAVGKLKAGPESELCARYLDRARSAGRSLGLRGFAVTELSESRAQRAVDRIDEEEAALLQALGQDGNVIGLDPQGELVDSASIAAALRSDADGRASRLTFVIGGPDGLGGGMLGRVRRRLSFGRLTWPHQIARILLAEQLYRATTILSGHPYHRS